MTQELMEMRGQEDAFSLTELMVVVLIIAILIAIAIPTFFSARIRADDRAAQASLRNALIAAKAIYSDSNSFSAADESATGLPRVEPGLTYVAHTSNSSGPRVISVRASATSWSAAVHSASGNCYWIREVGTASTAYGGDVSHPSSCSGDDADSAHNASFP
jgi:type IV pilus assembly protein PilA